MPLIWTDTKFFPWYLNVKRERKFDMNSVFFLSYPLENNTIDSEEAKYDKTIMYIISNKSLGVKCHLLGALGSSSAWKLPEDARLDAPSVHDLHVGCLRPHITTSYFSSS